MNIQFLKELAATNQWHWILPEIILALLGVSVLLMDLFFRGDKDKKIAIVSIGAQFLVLFYFINNFNFMNSPDTVYAFSDMLKQNAFGNWCRVFFIISSILVSSLGVLYLKKNKLPSTEFYSLVLIATASLMIMVQSSHFLLLFITLETATIAFYVLISYGRNSSLSLEAGLKYLILGGTSSAILMLGIVLLYGVAGNPSMTGYSTDSMNFKELGQFISLNQDSTLLIVGVLLVIAGFCFKIAVVPFQIWVPDVYQGAPTPIAAFLGVASKASGFFVLINLLTGPFVHLKEILVPFLSVIAIGSILFGNIAAVTQRNVKRLMGLSGVAHAGYLMIGLVASFSVETHYIIYFYLLTYLLASFSVFGVMCSVSELDARQELEDYEDLAKSNTFLGFILIVGLGSLAGIPPLAGFIAKLLLFITAIKVKLYLLVTVAVIGVVISIYYYFGWIREATFRIFRIEDENNKHVSKDYESGLSAYHKILFGFVAILSIVFGLFQTVFRGFIW